MDTEPGCLIVHENRYESLLCVECLRKQNSGLHHGSTSISCPPGNVGGTNDVSCPIEATEFKLEDTQPLDDSAWKGSLSVQCKQKPIRLLTWPMNNDWYERQAENPNKPKDAKWRLLPSSLTKTPEESNIPALGTGSPSVTATTASQGPEDRGRHLSQTPPLIVSVKMENASLREQYWDAVLQREDSEHK